MSRLESTCETQSIIQVPPDVKDKVVEEICESMELDLKAIHNGVVNPAIMDVAYCVYVMQQQKSGQRSVCGNEVFIIDFSHAKFFEPGVLEMIVAILKYRKDCAEASSEPGKYSTKIRLPVGDAANTTGRRLIDYLHAWRFDKLVNDIIGQPLTDFLDSESKDAWESWKEDESLYVDVRRFRGEKEYLLPKGYIPYTRIAVPQTIRSKSTFDEIREEAEAVAYPQIWEWVHGVIGTNLKGCIIDVEGKPAADVVGNRILSELIINAVIHPAAEGAYTQGSFHDGNFFLSVMDDGLSDNSLPNNLFEAVSERKATSPLFAQSREVFVVHYSGQSGIERYSTADIENLEELQPSPTIRDMAWLSTVAGVTARPGDKAIETGVSQDPNVHARLNGNPGPAGQGLSRMRRTSICSLGGYIEYAGSINRTMIRKRRRDQNSTLASECDEFEVFVRHEEGQTWPLAGNIWRAVLPAQRRL